MSICNVQDELDFPKYIYGFFFATLSLFMFLEDTLRQPSGAHSEVASLQVWENLYSIFAERRAGFKELQKSIH